MKTSDLLGENWRARHDAELNESTTLKTYAEQGHEYLTRIRHKLRSANQAKPLEQLRDEILAESPDSNPFWHKAVEDFLQTDLASSVSGFALQLKIIGETVHDHLTDQGANIAAENLVQQIHQFATWAKFGFNVFNLTHSLTAALILTEPPPLTEASFNLPFPAFAVVLPDEFLPFNWRADKQLWANRIWVHRYLSPRIEVGYQVTVECHGLSLWRRNTLDHLAEMNRASDQHLRAFDDDPELTSEDDQTLDIAMRIIRNLVAWFHATKPSAPTPIKHKKKRQSKNKEEAGPSPLVWILGQGLKIGPELRTMAKEIALGRNPRTAVSGWKVRMRHVVIGHWKQQAYGPEYSLRKEIWVEPYWRGPEGEAAWAHLYQPQEG